MAFTNLEERFNKNVDKLYAGAKSKFENGVPSTGRNDDPLIVREPNNGYWNVAESRSTPITSTANDVKRLTLFTLSKRGIAFLAKQQLLQTGNTFESTRIINPAFHISNAVPFIHAKRALDVPITARGIGRQLLGNNALSRRIFGGGEQKTDISDLRKVAQLQKETYDKVFTRVNGKSSVIPPIRNLVQRLPIVGPTVSAVTAKRSMGEIGNGWTYSRPELGEQNDKYFVYRKITAENKIDIPTFSNSSTAAATLTQKKVKYGPLNGNGTYTIYLSKMGEKKTPVETDYKKFISSQYKLIRNGIQKYQAVTETLGEGKNYSILNNQGVGPNELKAQIQNYLKNLEPEIRSGTSVKYLKYFDTSFGLGTLNDEDIINGKINTQTRANITREEIGIKKISYIKDSSNEPAPTDTYNAQSVQVPYKFINGAPDSFDDPITVSFAMGNDDSIRFRAFIKDIQQSITPQYNQLQYIGRIEKFINYVSVQREVSFKLGVIAFSKDEIDSVWRRINYLTGLVFPYGFNRGIHQPNIVKLTIGNIFKDQPGYVASLNTSFNELSESWDIDREVPISAQMDIKFVIIEKATKIAESPFYGITESDMEGFTTQIDTKDKLNSLDPTKAPTVRPITTSVEQRSPTTTTTVNQQRPAPVITTGPRNPQAVPPSTVTNNLLGGFSNINRPTGAGGLSNPFTRRNG